MCRTFTFLLCFAILVLSALPSPVLSEGIHQTMYAFSGQVGQGERQFHSFTIGSLACLEVRLSFLDDLVFTLERPDGKVDELKKYLHTVIMPQAGTYKILVTGRNVEASGYYQIFVATSPPGSDAKRVSFTGSLYAGEVKYVAVEVPSCTAFLEVNISGFDANAKLSAKLIDPTRYEHGQWRYQPGYRNPPMNFSYPMEGTWNVKVEAETSAAYSIDVVIVPGPEVYPNPPDFYIKEGTFSGYVPPGGSLTYTLNVSEEVSLLKVYLAGFGVWAKLFDPYGYERDYWYTWNPPMEVLYPLGRNWSVKVGAETYSGSGYFVAVVIEVPGIRPFPRGVGSAENPMLLRTRIFSKKVPPLTELYYKFHMPSNVSQMFMGLVGSMFEVHLFDPAGNERGCWSNVPVIEVSSPAEGDWVMRVKGYPQSELGMLWGYVRLEGNDLPTPSGVEEMPGSVAAGETVTHSINIPSGIQTFQVWALTKGDKVRINVINPWGVLASSFDSALCNVRSVFKPHPGEWKIRITGYQGSGRGEYQILIISDLSQPTPPYNLAPIVSFTYAPSAPTINDAVNFSDSSIDLDGAVVSWLWEFGDGENSTEQSPAHKYAKKGSYNVTLTVMDNEGKRNATSEKLTVYNIAPKASFVLSPEQPVVGVEVQFTDASVDPEGEVAFWLWNFGDGFTSTDQNPKHKYHSPGRYNVSLTVKDDEGVEDTAFKTIEVVEPPDYFGIMLRSSIIVAAIVGAVVAIKKWRERLERRVELAETGKVKSSDVSKKEGAKSA